MKRQRLIRHLTANACELLREGKKHSVFLNLTNRKTAPIPRHIDIDWRLVLAICKELGVEPPAKR
jgi:hypothetical protein